jgi:uncharacterized protein (TIGR00290 family)
MKVAVMFSGGKDSCQAVKHALDCGWEIKGLVAVKPRSTEAYLYHYATVEWTRLQAESMGLPLFLIKGKDIGPEREAGELRDVLRRLDIDALVMGGVGLQKTQIREIGKVAREFGIRVLVPHRNMSSEELFRKEIEDGFEIMITDVASDGLGKEWLGKIINRENFGNFLARARKFGFDPLGEGGYFNTFVLDGPIFRKRIEFRSFEKVWEPETESGFLEVKEAVLA